MAQAGHAQRVGRAGVCDALDIDAGSGGKRELQRVAAQPDVAQQAPQLAEVPAQRGERVFGILEQQGRQLLAADG